MTSSQPQYGGAGQPAPQQSPQQDNLAQPPGQPRPTAKPGKAPALLLGLLAGLLLGGGGVGLTWMLTSDAEGAVADAEAACAIVDRTPAFPSGPSEEGYDMVLRWGAGVTLAQAAAELDPAYESLSEKLHKPLVIFQETFKSEGPEFDQAMSEARAACADL